jgi:MFS family permease
MQTSETLKCLGSKTLFALIYSPAFCSEFRPIKQLLTLRSSSLWESRERGRAMGIFYLGPLLGPLLAPVIGGALAQAWGWRSTQWFQTIYGGLLFIILTFCLPETLPVENGPSQLQPVVDEKPEKTRLTRISTRQSVHLKTKKAAAVFKRCIIDPLSVLTYLRFPAVLITVYLASITFGSLYVLNISVQQTFSIAPYNYSVLIVGLLYIPNSLGYILASVFGGRVSINLPLSINISRAELYLNLLKTYSNYSFYSIP